MLARINNLVLRRRRVSIMIGLGWRTIHRLSGIERMLVAHRDCIAHLVRGGSILNKRGLWWALKNLR